MSTSKDDFNPRDTCNVEEAPLNIYQIGNSYTKSNNLPHLVEEVLVASGRTNIRIDSHSPPGKSFGAHLTNLAGNGPRGDGHPLHRSLILKKRQHTEWNWIILQNQSQVPRFIRDDPKQYLQSVENAKQMYTLLKRHNPGLQLMFMMTWGRRQGDKNNSTIFPDFLTMQSKLTAGYMRYVEATSSPECPTFVAPCGLVFQTIYNDLVKEGQNPAESGSLFYGLYVKDGSHPSLAGSYVAVLTIYASLTGKEASDLQWVPEGLDTMVAVKLRNAVSRTIQETLHGGLIRYPWQQ